MDKATQTPRRTLPSPLFLPLAASFFLTHCRAINAMVLLVRMLPIVPAGWDLSSSAFAVRHVDYAAGLRPGGHHIDRIDAIFFLGSLGFLTPQRAPSPVPPIPTRHRRSSGPARPALPSTLQHISAPIASQRRHAPLGFKCTVGLLHLASTAPPADEPGCHRPNCHTAQPQRSSSHHPAAHGAPSTSCGCLLLLPTLCEAHDRLPSAPSIQFSSAVRSHPLPSAGHHLLLLQAVPHPPTRSGQAVHRRHHSPFTTDSQGRSTMQRRVLVWKARKFYFWHKPTEHRSKKADAPRASSGHRRRPYLFFHPPGALTVEPIHAQL
ncbi:uncharacterized protein [Triticum aestivum]|uniref:uncharacterized protein n=1 Tax=Triticum aestivum TaxID=4565 RepID=UPI001D001B5E|nr:uncharacterized protein LOC123039281 [Triticum aestivum]